MLYRFPTVYEFFMRQFNTDPESLHLQQVDRMLALKELKENALILDIACGSGESTLILAQARPDCTVIGVDISEKMLAFAAQNMQEHGLENVRFICKSVLELTPADMHAGYDHTASENVLFDLITCSFGFSAMSNHYKQVFRDTVKLLAPGGWYVISDVYYPKTWRSKLWTTLVDPLFLGANPLIRPFLLLQEELAGYEIHETQTTYYGFLPAIEYVAKGVKR